MGCDTVLGRPPPRMPTAAPDLSPYVALIGAAYPPKMAAPTLAAASSCIPGTT